MSRGDDAPREVGAVRLGLRDTRALLATQGALLTPFAHATPDAWCRAVTAAAKSLLGADRAAFYLPVPRPLPTYVGASEHAIRRREDARGANGDAPSAPPVVPVSDEFTVAELTAYAPRIESSLATVPTFARMHELGAMSRDELTAPYREAYYASSYYHDYIVPVRALDCLALAVGNVEHGAANPGRAAHGARGSGSSPSGGSRDRVAHPTFATTAQLLLYHDQANGPRFGAHERAIVELLYPAFRAGVESWWALGRHLAALGGMLDALPLALAIVDHAGRDVHRTPALLRLLAEEPHPAPLHAAVRDAAARRTAVVAADRAELREPAGALPRVRTREHEYRVRAVSLAGLAGFGPSPEALTGVLVERVTPAARALPSAGTVGARLGLTPAQSRVALLVAEGRSNPDIAAQLGSSPHTVRHHLEQVFERTGVTSRSALAIRVLRLLPE